MRNKLITAAAIGCVLALVTSTAANAYVQKTGTTYCTQNQTGTTRAWSTWTTDHYLGGAAHRTFYNGSTWKATYASATVSGGGFWVVTTSGALDNGGTYGYCITGTP